MDLAVTMACSMADKEGGSRDELAMEKVGGLAASLGSREELANRHGHHEGLAEGDHEELAYPPSLSRRRTTAAGEDTGGGGRGGPGGCEP